MCSGMSESIISNGVSTKAILEAVNLKCIRNNKLIFEEIGFRLGNGDILQDSRLADTL